MEIKLSRKEALAKLVARHYFYLTQSDKLKLLEKIFPALEETDYVRDLINDGELPPLDETTITLIESKAYLKIPFDEALKPIFISLLKDELIGVTNDYLQWQLNDRDHHYLIDGTIEERGLCPCCHHYSLGTGEDALWDICAVCFWENGGNGPNHMTLEQAQQNFKTLGAISPTALKYIDPEGKLKYLKETQNV